MECFVSFVSDAETIIIIILLDESGDVDVDVDVDVDDRDAVAVADAVATRLVATLRSGLLINFATVL